MEAVLAFEAIAVYLSNKACQTSLVQAYILLTVPEPSNHSREAYEAIPPCTACAPTLLTVLLGPALRNAAWACPDFDPNPEPADADAAVPGPALLELKTDSSDEALLRFGMALLLRVRLLLLLLLLDPITPPAPDCCCWVVREGRLKPAGPTTPPLPELPPRYAIQRCPSPRAGWLYLNYCRRIMPSCPIPTKSF